MSAGFLRWTISVSVLSCMIQCQKVWISSNGINGCKKTIALSDPSKKFTLTANNCASCMKGSCDNTDLHQCQQTDIVIQEPFLKLTHQVCFDLSSLTTTDCDVHVTAQQIVGDTAEELIVKTCDYAGSYIGNEKCLDGHHKLRLDTQGDPFCKFQGKVVVYLKQAYGNLYDLRSPMTGCVSDIVTSHSGKVISSFDHRLAPVLTTGYSSVCTLTVKPLYLGNDKFCFTFLLAELSDDGAVVVIQGDNYYERVYNSQEDVPLKHEICFCFIGTSRDVTIQVRANSNITEFSQRSRFNHAFVLSYTYQREKRDWYGMGEIDPGAGPVGGEQFAGITIFLIFLAFVIADVATCFYVRHLKKLRKDAPPREIRTEPPSEGPFYNEDPIPENSADPGLALQPLTPSAPDDVPDQSQAPANEPPMDPPPPYEEIGPGPSAFGAMAGPAQPGPPLPVKVLDDETFPSESVDEDIPPVAIMQPPSYESHFKEK